MNHDLFLRPEEVSDQDLSLRKRAYKNKTYLQTLIVIYNGTDGAYTIRLIFGCDKEMLVNMGILTYMHKNGLLKQILTELAFLPILTGTYSSSFSTAVSAEHIKRIRAKKDLYDVGCNILIEGTKLRNELLKRSNESKASGDYTKFFELVYTTRSIYKELVSIFIWTIDYRTLIISKDANLYILLDAIKNKI